MAILPNPNAKLDELLQDAKMGRLVPEREAWLNLSFFLGQQYSEWNPETNSIREIPRKREDDEAPRPVINKIMHFVRQAHHDAMQDEPMPDVIPPTSDYADIADSQVARAWCDQEAGENRANYPAKLSRAGLWSIIAGNGYKKWSWDKHNKRIQISTPSFFEIYLDPYARSWDEVRYIIQSQFMDVEQVYETYGLQVAPEAIEKADEQKTALLRGMGCAPVVRGVVVNELWMKPSRRHEGGRFAAWTGRKQLIAPRDLPHPHLIANRSLPYTMIGNIERPDSPYFMSPVQFLRPAQMELNKLHAQQLMVNELFANPKWYVDSSLQLEEDPDGSPGQILRGTSTAPGMRPELLMPTTSPPTNLVDMMEQGMMHIVGQHEVSQAQVPGRVEAAKAIELLKESDAGAQATMRRTTMAATSQGWQHALELMRTYGPEEEMVMAYSRNGEAEVKHFRAKEMKPGFRIRTSMKTGLARSRAARQDLAIRLWDSKVIQDAEQLLDLMDVPTDNMLQYRINDKIRAKNENLVLAEGNAITPNSFDDHAIHLRELDAFCKSHDYDGLSPDAKKKIDAHRGMHKKMMKEQLVEQAELTMLAQGMQPGTTPPGGEPTPTTPTPEGEVQ